MRKKLNHLLTTIGMHTLALWVRAKGGPNRKKFIETVDSFFADVDKPDSPGCALAVFRGGEIFYSKGYGLADVENKVPITPQTIFNIGSNSKQFTAFSIYLLADEGKLSVDDDVRKYVPELPDYGHTITIQHLIHHTSGLRCFSVVALLAGISHESDTAEGPLRLITAQRELNYPPGEEYQYSNTNYFLMALIVERVTGMPFGKFARERIFEPLGMKHTRVRGSSKEPIPLLARGYNGEPAKGLREQPPGGDGGPGDVGAGEVFTSVEEMRLWHLNFRNRIVGAPRVFKWMNEPGRLNNGERTEYAGGQMRQTNFGVPVFSHGGGVFGYLSHFLRVPAFDLAVVCFSNCDSVDPFGRANQTAEAYAGRRKREAPQGKKEEEKPAAKPPEFAAAPAEELAKLSGFFEQEEVPGEFWTLNPEEGKLKVKSTWGGFSMGRVRENVYRGREFPDSYFHFDFDEQGRAKGFRELQKEKLVKTFVSREGELRGGLDEYAGVYRSEELGADYVVRVENGRLKLSVPEHEHPIKKEIMADAVGDGVLWPIGEDLCRLGSGVQFRFEREAGAISALLFQTTGPGYRVRRMRFTRKG